MLTLRWVVSLYQVLLQKICLVVFKVPADQLLWAGTIA